MIALWMIGGNLLAAKQEKEINQAWEQFAKQFPKTETNDSALKLQTLTAKLGLELYYSRRLKSPTDSSAGLALTEADRQAYQAINGELGAYITALIERPNDAVAIPSENLRRYLSSKAATLDAIRSHVLNNEVPTFEINIDYLNEGNPSVPLPSWLGMVNLQKILALDILEKNRQGKTSEALATLDVSWKINKSLRNRPELIAQLVALIVSNQQLAVIRRLDNLQIQWQQRLLEHDYRESILKALQGEVFATTAIIRELDLFSTEEMGLSRGLLLLLRFTSPINRPYLRFSAIDTYQAQSRSYSQLPQQNFCSLSLDQSKPEADPAWWNPIGQIATLSLPNLWLRAGRRMLDSELTQKILQVKALAVKLGRWPQSVPNLESSICPGEKWLYQVLSDGTMSLTFSKPLNSEKRQIHRLPLTYRANFTQAVIKQ
ncbi:MAG TPA: hypothetical protein V6C95_08520 [Coleofasciculaceae cyanobacterium]